ncbi:hypothetical protein D9758_018176 [Tetrapyrgos nigripes]|uniref:L-tryptophan decarboxylase PsiD-like domain-containing protein n=1 Tax=Tetrapyrgos nigripes TaxID=182062 RepID=A0A8H5B078_9AGAR|nr:hypothetical protein D9758_018176 [Tetrapyrgos nigripes]
MAAPGPPRFPHLIHHRVGGWLPKDHRVLESWLSKKFKKVQQRGGIPNFSWHPVITEFRELIENDADLYMVFHQMFEQVPTKPPYNNDPTGKPQIRNYMKMLSLFDCILTEAPEYEDNDLVGFPINAILDWPMGTPAGLAGFMNPKSPDSRYVLTTEDPGWFGPSASSALPNFDSTFICSPTAPYKGFQSWDDFFTRRFLPGLRPVVFPDDDNIINSACESTAYAIARDIKLRDEFWLKSEPYSLLHMTTRSLNSSPVNGTVKRTLMIPGTYYAESPFMGFINPDGPDPGAPNLSQGFITQVAARALVFIEVDNPKIGLMCFMAIGMAEVSTCEIGVSEGQRIKKGEELGMFHFGGSTH